MTDKFSFNKPDVCDEEIMKYIKQRENIYLHNGKILCLDNDTS